MVVSQDKISNETQLSQEQMKLYMQQWMEWIDFISARGQLADGENHFSREGQVLQPKNIVTQGPNIDDNISVAGFIITYAKDLNNATTLVKKCPILAGKNTSVEVREIKTPD